MSEEEKLTKVGRTVAVIMYVFTLLVWAVSYAILVTYVDQHIGSVAWYEALAPLLLVMSWEFRRVWAPLAIKGKA